MALPETPLTRGEQYLAKAAGQDTAIPDVPLTRVEQYLAKIAGEDVAVPHVVSYQITPDEGKVLTSTGNRPKLRLAGYGSGANLIVTINEVIA